MEEQILSRYSIQKYIDKKWKDISKDIPTVKAYKRRIEQIKRLQLYWMDTMVLEENEWKD